MFSIFQKRMFWLSRFTMFTDTQICLTLLVPNHFVENKLGVLTLLIREKYHGIRSIILTCIYTKIFQHSKGDSKRVNNISTKLVLHKCYTGCEIVASNTWTTLNCCLLKHKLCIPFLFAEIKGNNIDICVNVWHAILWSQKKLCT